MRWIFQAQVSSSTMSWPAYFAATLQAKLERVRSTQALALSCLRFSLSSCAAAAAISAAFLAYNGSLVQGLEEYTDKSFANRYQHCLETLFAVAHAASSFSHLPPQIPVMPALEEYTRDPLRICPSCLFEC